MSREDDYIIRLIHQLGKFIAEVAGFSAKADHDEDQTKAGQSWDDLLDAPRGLIDVVDTPTLAGMLREPAKIRAAARLSSEEARAFEANGDPLRAGLRYRRAVELLLEARVIDPGGRDDAAIAELLQRVPVATLDPRYRELAGASK